MRREGTTIDAKASKCQFGRSSVGCLGHVISERGVTVDPRKIAAVVGVGHADIVYRRARFVGLANYYRKFVLRFSALAAKLTALCSPSAQFTWGPAEQQSFDALNAALTSAPVLRGWNRAADAPAHRRIGAGRVGHPGSVRQRGCVSPCRFRVT